MGCTPSKAAKKKPVDKKHCVLAAPPPRPPEMLKTPVAPTPALVRPAGSHEDLVSAPTAQPPQFEETSKEGQEEQKKEPPAKEMSVKKIENREPASFHWPSAYEVKEERKERKPTEEEMNASRKAERAAHDKEAFLAECKREKKRRKESALEEDRDDTLFEQPTRMPNMDFVSDKTLIF